MPAFSSDHYRQIELRRQGKVEVISAEQKAFNEKADMALFIVFSPFLLAIAGMGIVGGLCFLKAVGMLIISLAFLLVGAQPPF